MAREAMKKASQLRPLSTIYGVGEQQFLDMVKQYGSQLFGGGGGSPFSQANIRNQANAFLGGPEAYNYLATGDPAEQYQRMQTLQEFQNYGQNPYLAEARQRGTLNQFNEWLDRSIKNAQGTPQSWFEQLGYQAPPSTTGAYAAPAQSGPTTPAGGPTSETPAAAPQSSAQMQAQTAGGQFADWQQLFDYLLQGHDPRNLMTSGFTAPGRAFTFGNVSFNPAVADATGGRTDRDPSKRFGGGAAWTGFAYRLRQLIDQRNRERAGGVDFPEVSGTMSDQDIARLAAQWVNERWRGNTGLTIA